MHRCVHQCMIAIYGVSLSRPHAVARERSHPIAGEIPVVRRACVRACVRACTLRCVCVDAPVVRRARGRRARGARGGSRGAREARARARAKDAKDGGRKAEGAKVCCDVIDVW
jgi:hypothetical protein